MIQNSSISLKKWTNPTATYCSYWIYALFMEYSTVMKLQEVSRYKPSTYILTEKEKIPRLL